MNNNFYIACIIEEGGKRSAFDITVSSAQNIVDVLAKYNGLTAANLFPTKKKAKETADFWNECFKKNGTYMFGAKKKRYTLSYCSRYGYSIEFDPEFTEALDKARTSNEIVEEEFYELCGELNKDGTIDDFGTDLVQFCRWFGEEPDEYDERREGDLVNFPASVKAKAEEITKVLEDFLVRSGVKAV